MKLARFRLLTVLILLPLCAQAESMQLEVIELRHRNAEAIIPVIQPLLVAGGMVTGMNNQLIVKTTAGNLAEIKTVLASVDKALRRLMISVRQDIAADSGLSSHSLSGHYETEQARVASAGNDRRTEIGTSISALDSSGNIVTYRNTATRSATDDYNTFKVQTVEGQPAFIQSGISVPIANQTSFVVPGGIVVHDGVEYRDVNSGFYVVPRLSGNRVTLLISPQLSRPQPNQGSVFDIQNIETTASGQLGEWIRIGGIDRSSTRHDSGNFFSTRDINQERRAVLIKVDEVP